MEVAAPQSWHVSFIRGLGGSAKGELIRHHFYCATPGGGHGEQNPPPRHSWQIGVVRGQMDETDRVPSATRHQLDPGGLGSRCAAVILKGWRKDGRSACLSWLSLVMTTSPGPSKERTGSPNARACGGVSAFCGPHSSQGDGQAPITKISGPGCAEGEREIVRE